MNVLVLDIGGSSIKYAQLDEQLRFSKRGEVPTPMDSMEQFVDTIASLYETCKDEVEGIAISMPGCIDPKRGFNYHGGALTYIRDMKTVAILQERIPCPITIGNDAKCAANAEVGYGNLKGIQDGVVIILGTGIGGCIIKDGKVHNGKHFSAGEFSFIKTNCDQGHEQQQHWCYVNGIRGLLSKVQHELHSDQVYSGKEIFEMANAGNVAVLKALDSFCEAIAMQIYNLQAIFDPERFVIGGGISAQPLLMQCIQKQVDKLFQEQLFDNPKAEVYPCKFRNDANLIGAFVQFKDTYR